LSALALQAWFLALVLVLAQSSPVVSVSIDRASYSPGDQVLVTVRVAGGTLNSRLWLYVDKPEGHNLHFAELPASGGEVRVTLPVDAPPGFYTVIVTWDHQYVETGFIVEGQPIPEFPITPMVFIIAFAIATLATSRRQASTRTKTSPTDSRTHIPCRGLQVVLVWRLSRVR
jgi:hypothetical protein